MKAGGADLDPYLVLGVARTATAGEVRAAYRALGAKYHPDRHQGNPLEELASAKMAEINRAYELLSDPARRAAFDRGGVAEVPEGGSPGSRAGRRLIPIVALLSLLPLVVRFGGLIARGVVALVRTLAEGAALVRGTPFAAGAVLLAAAVLVGTLIRRRRRAARDKFKGPGAAAP